MGKVKRFNRVYERACVEIKTELMSILRRRKGSIKDAVNLALDHFLQEPPAPEK